MRLSIPSEHIDKVYGDFAAFLAKPEFKEDIFEREKMQYIKEKPFIGTSYAPDVNFRIKLLDSDNKQNTSVTVLCLRCLAEYYLKLQKTGEFGTIKISPIFKDKEKN